MGWLTRKHASPSAFHLGHLLSVGRTLPPALLWMAAPALYLGWGGALQAGKGWFQFRNPILDLWGNEMRLVLFLAEAGLVISASGWSSTEAPCNSSSWHQEVPEPWGEERAASCFGDRPFTNMGARWVEATRTLMSIHAWSFSLEGITKSMIF